MNRCKTCGFWERLKTQVYRDVFKYEGNKEPVIHYHDYDIEESGNKWLVEHEDLGIKVCDFGNCSCPKFMYKGIRHYEIETQHDTSALYYCDGEEYSAWLETGKDFGCIYWKPKE